MAAGRLGADSVGEMSIILDVSGSVNWDGGRGACSGILNIDAVGEGGI